MSNLNKLAWNQVDWTKVESRVFRMQRRIYKAKSKNKIDTVHYLQTKLLHSLDAKLLSVRKVSKLPENISLVQKLNLKITDKQNNNFITRKNKKVTTHLCNNSIILEKSKETLIKLALEPEWETVFSKNCYGERPGYKYQDAILNILEKIDSKPIYVLILDLSDSFNDFDERLLEKLNAIKAVKKCVEYWLKYNFLKNFAQKLKNTNGFQNKEIIKDNPIAPLLYNIALTGLEPELMKWHSNVSHKNNKDTCNELNYIQYFDKLLISHSNKEMLEKAKKFVIKWLCSTGIKCTQNQVSIKKTTEGFDFLGFHIIVIKQKNRYFTKTHISRESKNALLKQTRMIIQKNKSISSYELINKLLPIITTWKNYFIYCDCSVDFKQMDNRLFNQLRAWVFRRKANGKNRHFLKEKYFPKTKKYLYENKIYNSNWVLYGKTKTINGKSHENYLPKLRWSKPKYYVRLEKTISIYL